jgi:hypothetical protein
VTTLLKDSIISRTLSFCNGSTKVKIDKEKGIRTKITKKTSRPTIKKEKRE